MIKKDVLKHLYLKDGYSVQAIADKLGYSRRGVKYWMDKHSIKSRTISEAIYLWHNPNGDPFQYSPPKTLNDYKLFGLGLGLYWGEGTRSDKGAVRLGNTDPELINTFINFLKRFFGIKKRDIKLGLQIFSDISKKQALNYWSKKLNIKKEQFQKTVVTKSGSIGTYRHKNLHGVLTIYYCNTKMRKLMDELMPT